MVYSTSFLKKYFIPKLKTKQKKKPLVFGHHIIEPYIMTAFRTLTKNGQDNTLVMSDILSEAITRK